MRKHRSIRIRFHPNNQQEQAKSRRCDSAGKVGQKGHKASHANNKAIIVRAVNLQKRRD